MQLNQLKERFSLRSFGARLWQAVGRFPVALCFLLLLTVVLSVNIVHDGLIPDRYFASLVYFLSVAMALDLGFTLWGEILGKADESSLSQSAEAKIGDVGKANVEEQPARRRRIVAESVVLALWAGYCLWFALTDAKFSSSEAFGVGNMSWVTAVLLSLPFVAYLREEHDLKAWHLLMSACLSLIICGVIASAMFGGIEGLIYGTIALFEIKQNYKIMNNLNEVTAVVCFVFLFGALFLSMVPQGVRMHNVSEEVPVFLRRTVLWLLLPLLGCYMLVLYVYGGSIVVRWELPKGTLSKLVSAVVFGWMACYVLLYPCLRSCRLWQQRLLTRWLPAAILPLLVLMLVGVVRRFSDYGITAARLYLVTLLVWYFAVVIAVMVSSGKRFRWIFLSFAAAFLLTSAQPLNYYFVTKKVLLHEVEATVRDKGLSLPLDLGKAREDALLTDDEADQLGEKIIYLRRTYNKDLVSDYWGDSGIGRYDKEESPTEAWQEVEYDEKNYYDRHVCPQGYAAYYYVSSYRSNVYVDAADGQGVFRVVEENENDTVVLLLDTAAIGLAQRNKGDLIISSADGEAALVATGVLIQWYNDGKITANYSGALFVR